MGRRILFLATLMLAGAVDAAPNVSLDGVWEGLDAVPAEKHQQKPWVRPPKARPVRLQRGALEKLLKQVRPERGGPAAGESTEIILPMPDGSFARFRAVESSVMAPELAARYPEIKTYLGYGVDDPAATVRFDWTPAGFHAQILSPKGAVYIDPFSQGDTEYYTSYYKRDYRKEADGWVCLVRGGEAVAAPAAGGTLTAQRSGSTLRVYRLACAATGEYTAFHGGTVPAGLAAIVTSVNRVTGVYETELSIRLVLVANNDLLVYTNSGTDPYTNNNPSSLLTQNQSTCDSVIGTANYDIGHVFSTAGGGLAYLGAVCKSASKAQGETGTSSPVGDAFDIDYVAHEMGHQFGANHTFNSTTSNCGGGNRNASTAYEPGSGTTIMAYAGICGADNVQLHSDPYFHSVSFDEIIAYVGSGGGSGCASNVVTGNTAPAVSAGFDYTIPASTPFVLTASGSDSDGDSLRYCWEERDLGAAQALTDADNGSSPLFRVFNPTSSPTRIFPKLSAILANTNSLAERLPTTTRTMNFRVTARDNRVGGGGVNTDDMIVNVASTAGPFVLTAPNSSVTLSGAVTVTWNVAGTTNTPVSCSGVDVWLSTDGGTNYPTLLASNTPNDGSQVVVLPNINTTKARIKVQGANNIFFDVSDATFTIVPGIPTPLPIGAGGTLAGEGCAPGNGAIDPNETVTIAFGFQNVGSGNTTNLVATLLAIGGVTAPSGPQTYGVLTAGVAAVSRPFTFTATGSCGGTVTAVLQLQDGPTDYGLITNTFSLGSTVEISATNANSGSISIAQKGKASPYPSAITVSGFTGAVTRVTVKLLGLSHTYPDDLDILLVGPGGQKVMLMSDAGGGGALSGVDLTFAATGSALPDSTQIATGTYQPADYEAGESLASPAPTSPYSTDLAVFNNQDPNGTWSLYIEDDSAKDGGSLAGGWQLVLTSSSNVCCSGASADLAVTVTDAPDPVYVVSNLTYTVTVTNLGPSEAASVVVTDSLPASVNFISASPGCTYSNGAVTCSIGSLNPGTATNLTIIVAPTAPGSLTNTVLVSSAVADPVAGNNAASTVTTVRDTPPILTGNPSSQNVCAGSPVNFSVTVTGNNLAYQWQKDAVNLSNGSPYAGVTTADLSVSPAEAGDYRCLVSNTGGSVTSAVASLTLKAATVITGQPTAQAVCLGGSAQFSVAATGAGPLGYQWQKNTVDLSNGGHYSGANSNVLTVANADNSDAATYRCVVTADCGSVISSNAALTVSYPVLAVSPPSLNFGTIATGTTAYSSFTVSNAGCGTLSVTVATGGAFGVTPVVFGVVAGNVTNVEVSFTPATEGAFSTNVYLTSNGGSSTNSVSGAGAVAPVASCTAMPTIGQAPLNVTFTDTSSGTITNRFWQFGDGGTNNTTVTSVAHTYAAPGSNTVWLTVSGPLGVSSNQTLIVVLPTDTDGDGLPDAYELANSLNPNDSTDAGKDSDGDGFTNTQEYLAGTNPQLASSALRITATALANGDFRVSFSTVTGKFYGVEHNTDLTVTNGWNAFTNNVPGTGGTVEVIDPGAAALPRQFYRVRLVP